MSTNQNNNEEEVDLGSLFLIIGKGFSKLFNFIGNVFKGFFHFLISILLFIKLHFKKIAIAAFIGGILGAYLEHVNEDKFGSNMLVQPNFKSTNQLYENINYYNDLVEQENVSLLASVFNMDTIKAAGFKKFEINPVVNDIDVINAYNKFILFADTLTVKSYDFFKFKKSFTVYDYEIHNISVEATISDIFTGLDEVIISSVENNYYYNRIKYLTNENLFRTDSLLRANLTEVDSLRQVYMRIMLEESKKESSGTNIDFGGTQKNTKEIELFETDREINEDLGRISIDIGKQSEVINIISNFKTVGYEIKGITKNLIFILAARSVLLMLLFILLLDLNRYLSNYKK
tara:strand:- start:237 stop:1274 length:1038 start_codon:yes stop_codon:yes gene_type:complete